MVPILFISLRPRRIQFVLPSYKYFVTKLDFEISLHVSLESKLGFQFQVFDVLSQNGWELAAFLIFSTLKNIIFGVRRVVCRTNFSSCKYIKLFRLVSAFRISKYMT